MYKYLTFEQTQYRKEKMNLAIKMFKPQINALKKKWPNIYCQVDNNDTTSDLFVSNLDDKVDIEYCRFRNKTTGLYVDNFNIIFQFRHHNFTFEIQREHMASVAYDCSMNFKIECDYSYCYIEYYKTLINDIEKESLLYTMEILNSFFICAKKSGFLDVMGIDYKFVTDSNEYKCLTVNEKILPDFMVVLERLNR